MSDSPGWNSPDPSRPSGDRGFQSPPPSDDRGFQPPPPSDDRRFQQPPSGPPQPRQPFFGMGKPGVIPLRPLGLGEILDGAISTMRKYPLVVLGAAAVVVTVIQLANLPLVVAMTDDLGRLSTADSATMTPDELLDALGTTLGLTVVALLFTLLGTFFLAGLLTAVVGKAVIGRLAGFKDVWQDVKPRLLRLLGLTMIYPIAFAVLLAPVMLVGFVSPPLGVLLGIVVVFAAVWLGVLFSLATPALILEHGTVLRSLGRSRELVQGSWWRIFGITLLAWIIAGILARIISIPFELAGGGFSLTDPGQLTTSYLVLSSVGAIIASTITQPFSASVSALLYIDQRMRREGLDIELARSAGIAAP